MFKIGIFFGSSTGNTERVAHIIHKNIVKRNYYVKIYNIKDAGTNDFLKFNFLILGTSTWYKGELQYHWNKFLPKIKNISFQNKVVSLFGCGNQLNYSKYFCNGISILHNVLIQKKVKIIGYWANLGYKFISSNILINSKKCVGLLIDEDNQSEYTNKRVNLWIKQLFSEIKFV